MKIEDFYRFEFSYSDVRLYRKSLPDIIIRRFPNFEDAIKFARLDYDKRAESRKQDILKDLQKLKSEAQKVSDIIDEEISNYQSGLPQHL